MHFEENNAIETVITLALQIDGKIKYIIIFSAYLCVFGVQTNNSHFKHS